VVVLDQLYLYLRRGRVKLSSFDGDGGYDGIPLTSLIVVVDDDCSELVLFLPSSYVPTGEVTDSKWHQTNIIVNSRVGIPVV
jgi:hypothetical protein